MAAVRLSRNDLNTVAEFVCAEFQRRQGSPKRKALEKQWKEVDRQIAMDARPNVARNGRDDTRLWMPALELPDQAAALEVLQADSRRLLFPPGDDWFSAHAVLTDRYLERFRETGHPLQGLLNEDIPEGQLDQDSADLVVHSTLSEFHSLYNHRGHWDLMLVEGLKYGTFAGRAGLVNLETSIQEYRGIQGRSIRIPVIIPVGIKNLLLDDTPQIVMHEGLMIAPSYIRFWFQRPADIVRAARSGGEGWRPEGLKKLQERPKDRKTVDQVKVVEMEGDFLIPRSRDDIWLQNYRITVVPEGGAAVVRLRESPEPFRSYITGTYQRDDVDSPYGSSPLLKGEPLQRAMSEAANRTMQAAALNTEPPVSYASDDQDVAARGGLDIMPAAQWELSRPDKITVHNDIGDPTALFAIFSGLSQRYDELTSTSQPRQSGEIKSHTTAEGNVIAQSRSVLPTEDFTSDVEMGPMTTWLYMEHELAKKALGSPFTVYVKAQDAHIEVRKGHWPDRANFKVRGALGVIDKQRKAETLARAVGILLPVDQADIQTGGKPMNYAEIKRRVLKDFDVEDADNLVSRTEGDVIEPSGEAGTAADSAGIAQLNTAAA